MQLYRWALVASLCGVLCNFGCSDGGIRIAGNGGDPDSGPSALPDGGPGVQPQDGGRPMDDGGSPQPDAGGPDHDAGANGDAGGPIGDAGATNDGGRQVDAGPAGMGGDSLGGVTNPQSCTATGNVVVYHVTSLVMSTNVNDGFDLDASGHPSCEPGFLATSPEGAGNVDNGWAQLLNRADRIVSGTSDALNDLLSAAMREGTTAIDIVLDVNDAEDCALATLVSAGEAQSAIPFFVNVADDGAFSGVMRLLEVALPTGGTPAYLRIDNVVLRGNLSGNAFSGLLGGSTSTEHGGVLGSEILPGVGPLVGQAADIRRDRAASGFCDSISLALLVDASAD